MEIAYLVHYLSHSANDVMSGAGSLWAHAHQFFAHYGALEKGGVTD